MNKLKVWLEKLYDRKITQEFDRVVPVVGDEGVGKSTLMLEIVAVWKDITGQERDTDEIIDQIVWGERDELKQALSDRTPRTAIPVMDAAHALYKQEAVYEEQIDLIKDLLDVRMKEHLILLGFQEWRDIPTMIQQRRAKNALYIPKRGLVRGYNRDSLDERCDSDSWPQADLTDTYPSLEGTDLWSKYKRKDREQKEQRMRGRDGDEDGAADNTDLFAVAEEIKNDGLENVISIHGGHNKPYVDPSLIDLHYDLSTRKAKKVKKLLDSDPDVNPEEHGGEA